MQLYGCIYHNYNSKSSLITVKDLQLRKSPFTEPENLLSPVQWHNGKRKTRAKEFVYWAFWILKQFANLKKWNVMQKKAEQKNSNQIHFKCCHNF